jgi:hypothetical protein
MALSELKQWIEGGISIDKNRDGGYKVFTIPTQHFDVERLEDITPDRLLFEEEQERLYRGLINNYFRDKNKHK